MSKDAAAVAVATDKTIPKTWIRISISLYKDFADVCKLKHDNDDQLMNKNEDYDLERVFYLGLCEFKKENTGYEIIHDGKKADSRVLTKLGHIAFELKKMNTYPKIDSSVLLPILNKALGNMDKRSLEKYGKTILYYCNEDEKLIEKCKIHLFGILNVSRFVKRVPYSYVKENNDNSNSNNKIT